MCLRYSEALPSCRPRMDAVARSIACQTREEHVLSVKEAAEHAECLASIFLFLSSRMGNAADVGKTCLSVLEFPNSKVV